MKPEIVIPLAYFITFRSYGTWLPGEKETWVDRHTNIPGTKFPSFDSERLYLVKKCMLESPYVLDETRCDVVLQSIQCVCQFRKWALLAAHVRSNHIHFVVHALLSPEQVLNTVKAYASRCLREAALDLDRKKRWSRHGSTRYLWTEAQVEATIQYVVYEQGLPMAVFENKTRKVETLF